jgi:hypothetical protein
MEVLISDKSPRPRKCRTMNTNPLKWASAALPPAVMLAFTSCASTPKITKERLSPGSGSAQ